MGNDVFDNGVLEDERPMPQTRDQIHLKEFIMQFESLSEIWDGSHEHFTNKVKRAHAYQKLLIIFKKIKPNATTDDVRKKINSLRSNYRKELKKVVDSQRPGIETDQIYKSRSWVFHMLHFLSKSEKCDCPNNLSGSEDVQDGEDEENSQQTGSVFFSSLNILPPPPKKERKRSTAENNEYVEDYSLPSQPERPEARNMNAAALYWVQKLEQIDPIQRIFAEKAINDILFEAEMGTLKRNSVQINVPTSSGQFTPDMTSAPSSNAENSATSSPNNTTSVSSRSVICKYAPGNSQLSVSPPPKSKSVHIVP